MDETHSSKDMQTNDTGVSRVLNNLFGDQRPEIGIITLCVFLFIEAGIGFLSTGLFLLLGLFFDSSINSVTQISIISFIVMARLGQLVAAVGVWKYKVWGWYGLVLLLLFFICIRIFQIRSFEGTDTLLIFIYSIFIFHLYQKRSDFVTTG